jgi:hypothetical protein
MKQALLSLLSAAGLLLGAVPVPGPLLHEVEGIIGRPLTPLSYAGVARRTTRRAVYGAAVVAPAYAHPYAHPYYW